LHRSVASSAWRYDTATRPWLDLLREVITLMMRLCYLASTTFHRKQWVPRVQ
jgi:hypothetical protein